MKGLELTASEVVNRWLQQGERFGEVKASRRMLLGLLQARFPNQVSAEDADTVNQQDSLELLDEWFQAAVRAYTFSQFVEFLRQRRS
jgi:hypothetical protein